MTVAQFDQALRASQTFEQINEALKEYLLGFGITTYAFTYYSYYPSSLNKLKYDISSPDFAIWHKHYLSAGYEDVDTTLEEVYQATRPIFWNLEQQLKEAKTKREKKMRQDGLDFGARCGVSIPIHGPHEDFAILLLVQMDKQTCLQQFSKIQYDIFAAAYAYYNVIRDELLKSQPPDNKHQLSSREMQCLVLLSRQYSVETIAKDLEITERTVNYHIQRLNKKLGTQNKYQSVIKALQTGLIKGKG